MARPFDNPKDWAELCTYFDGKAREYDLSPVQYSVMDHILGLSDQRPVSDEDLAKHWVPAILKALQEERNQI